LRQSCRQGAEVTVVIVTQGGNGVSITDAAQGAIITRDQRVAESKEAFAGSGIAVECLGMADGALMTDRALISSIEATLVRLGCTVLVTHSPNAANDHQDHRAVAAAASNAANRLRTCTAILYGEPHEPRSTFTPNLLFDVTDLIEDKVAALRLHQSQDGRWYLSEEFIRQRAVATGWRLVPLQAAQGRYYEAFECRLMVVTSPHSMSGKARL
jgi:LmbE family N-acetylglucosaminyl deacetylase